MDGRMDRVFHCKVFTLIDTLPDSGVASGGAALTAQLVIGL